MPWYKLPHTDTRMWFDDDRPDLELADEPTSAKVEAAPKGAKAKTGDDAGSG